MVTDGVRCASYLPTDGYLDPSQLTYALAEGAREGGVQIFTHTRVTGIEVGRRARARRVRPSGGRIEAEVVVNAGGMYAAEIGRLAGRARADHPVRARVPGDAAVPRARARRRR